MADGVGPETLSPIPHSPSVSVLVFGGFHKENIKRILEAKGISYIVVSPRITKMSPRHQDYYKHLMTQGHLAFEMPFLLAKATRALSIFYDAGSGPVEVKAVANTARLHPEVDVQLLDKYLTLSTTSTGSTPATQPVTARAEMRSPKTESHLRGVILGKEGLGRARAETREEKKGSPEAGELGQARRYFPFVGLWHFFLTGLLFDFGLYGLSTSLIRREFIKMKAIPYEFYDGWMADFWTCFTSISFVMLLMRLFHLFGPVVGKSFSFSRKSMTEKVYAMHGLMALFWSFCEVAGPVLYKMMPSFWPLPNGEGSRFDWNDLLAIWIAMYVSYGIHKIILRFYSEAMPATPSAPATSRQAENTLSMTEFLQEFRRKLAAFDTPKSLVECGEGHKVAGEVVHSVIHQVEDIERALKKPTEDTNREHDLRTAFDNIEKIFQRFVSVDAARKWAEVFQTQWQEHIKLVRASGGTINISASLARQKEVAEYLLKANGTEKVFVDLLGLYRFWDHYANRAEVRGEGKREAGAEVKAGRT